MGIKRWWPEIGLMSEFAKKRNYRAWKDTKEAIGWNRHKALFTVVFVVGFSLDFFIRGWAVVKEELWIAFIY